MNKQIKFLLEKSEEEIISEWDRIAVSRDEQISSDLDHSFSTVLEPWILERLNDAESVLDVGCGSGRLTAKIGKSDHRVLGIDPSPSSIEIARQHDKRGEYVVTTVEEWSEVHPDAHFNLVIANMVIMDVLHLDKVMTALSRLSQDGRLLITFTHPAFWPKYWGYSNHPSFNYSDEILVEAPFKTASVKYSLTTTHVHRPLSRYLKAFQDAGLQITNFEELRGPESPEIFPFPRFIGIEASSNYG